MIRVLVQTGPFDVAAELGALEGAGVGAVASFTGIVRADEGVEELFLEHYPVVTEAALHALAAAAAERWALTGITIVHRVGALVPGDRIVLVACAAAHRGAALDGCASLIDQLKTGAPFWKRERRGAATTWVEPRGGDTAAAARWRQLPGDADG